MRIIAGEFRGRKLLPPESDITRPVTDRVKQSVFDILSPMIGGAVVYDCFAGTGSMGLECLSRGAKHMTFFEADRSAKKRLGQNIETLKLEDRSEVIGGDLFVWFAQAKPKVKADLIFLDPPYRFLRERREELKRWAELVAERHIADDGVIVFRHDAADTLVLPDLVVSDHRDYGSMIVEFLNVKEPRTK